jgi:predicted dehydrogenase
MSEQNSAPIRVGVIGVGQIGKRHVEQYQKVPNAQIVAVSDLNEAEAQRVAEQFGIPHVYRDFRELLQRDDIDAVDVCLHNNYHRPMTVAALQAGKHVYCEKPMAGSYRDALTMWETAQQCGKKLHIQISNLYNIETRAAKTLIEEGHLGEIYHARSVGHRRRGRPFVDGYGTPTFVQKKHSGGGALFDMGVYHIATILHLMGNPNPTRISGKTYQKVEIDAARLETSGYDVEELGLGLVRFDNDATLDIVEAWAIHLGGLGQSVVAGDKGGLSLDPFAFFRNEGDLQLDSKVDMNAFKFRLDNVRGLSGLYDTSQHHWIAALQNRVEMLPTAKLALNTSLISEGIYFSNQLGREVSVEEVLEASKPIEVNV